MGGKSSSSSKQSTNQTSFSFGLDGDNYGAAVAGDNNQVTITDGGAFALVGDAMAGVSRAVGEVLQSNNDTTNSAFSFADGMADSAFDFAGDSQREAFGFAGQVVDGYADVMADAADLQRDAMSEVGDASRRAIDANTDLAELSILEGSNLAQAVARLSSDTALAASEDATGKLVRGFESMMGFADQVSRSDGQQVAISSNKTLMIFAASAAAVGVAIALKKG